MNACMSFASWWSLQAPEQELELPEDMALDGEQGDEEGQEGGEDDAGTGEHDDAVQQAFPEGTDKDETASENGEDQQGPDADAPEGPPEEGEHTALFMAAVLV